MLRQAALGALRQLEAVAERSLCGPYVPACAPSTSYATTSECTSSAAAVAPAGAPSVAQPSLADLQYARRVQEMLSFEQQGRQQQQQRRQRRRLDLDSVPAFRPPGGGGCGAGSGSADAGAGEALASLPWEQPARQPPARPPAVDWREVMAHVRATGRGVTGEQMLTDTFRRKHTYLRISLTERCNLRCTYCMPEEGVDLTPSPQLLTADEVERLARLFVRAGVDKVRLTGGEPTVRRDLPDIVSRLGALRPLGLRSVAITTNGLTLARQLPALAAAGLSAVNVSLDTLRPERFERLTRRRGHSRVLESIRAALDAGFDPVKVNVVLMRGVNEDEIGDFVELTRRDPVNVRFIEYMPFDGNQWGDGGRMVPFREAMARVLERYPEGLQRLDDPAGEVAKNFAVPGFRGSVSFITSMTQAFCGDCNRLRLLADGALKVCLFGPNEVSLRDAMRGGASDEELAAVISAAVDNKRAAHAGMEALAVTQNRPMITIGG